MIPVNVGQYLRYEGATGHLIWRVDRPRSDKARAGTIAGCVDNRGYRRIGILGQYYQAHRIVWFLVTGKQPPAILDHKDTNKLNNRIENLRPATDSQNGANRRSSRRGPKGVTLHSSGKYQAQIKCRGENHYLGLFHTEEDASSAYAAKAAELFGEFARAA